MSHAREMASVVSAIADELAAKQSPPGYHLMVIDLRVASKRLEREKELLEESLDAMLNLAPRIRDERRGCFGNMQDDCPCTACKIRRELL